MASSSFLRRVTQLAVLPLIGFAVTLLFASLMVSLRLEKAVADLVEARATLIASQMSNVVEAGLRFGIPIADQSEAPRKMDALIGSDIELLTIALFDDTGKPFLVKSSHKTANLDDREIRRLLSKRPSKLGGRVTRAWRVDGEIRILMQARDATGSTGALVWVAYSAKTVQLAFSATLNELFKVSALIFLGAAILIFSLTYGMWQKWEKHVAGSLTRLGDEAAADPGANQVNPLPMVPLTEALAQLANADQALREVRLKMGDLSV